MIEVLKDLQCIAILDSSLYGTMRIEPDHLTAADLASLAQDAHDGKVIYASQYWPCGMEPLPKKRP